MSHKMSWEQNPIVRGMLQRPYLTRDEVRKIFAKEDDFVGKVDGMFREYDRYHETLAAPPAGVLDPDNPRNAPHVQRREGVFRFADAVQVDLLKKVSTETGRQIEVIDPILYRRELARILKGRSADAFLDARRPLESAYDLLSQVAYGNIRFIAKVAARHVRRYPGTEFLDLLHEGVFGGVRAGKRYNQFAGSYLACAASWIRQQIQHYVFDTSRVIRVPVHRWQQLRAILCESNLLWHEAGSVSLDALAERTHLSPETIQECVDAFSMHASLQGGFTEEDDDRTLEGVVASDAPSPQDSALDRLLAERLREEVSRLPDRDRHVITRYFGLDGRPAETLEQIGTSFGCTKEWIRQIKERALERLRLRLPLTGEDVPY